MTDNAFSQRVLQWHRVHGRHDLPWQRDVTAYRVWISEIMLQQTQVATVIPYYERFIQRFPDIESLAAARDDDVLHHWSGLGYYARARNLHKAAKTICDEHNGVFPTDYDTVLALPGIGRSTAGAILALATGQRHAILDGNVKRVMARFFAIDGWPGQRAVADTLWTQAQRLTPDQDVAAYTQAMMDLGATVCTRRNPACPGCPLKQDCAALAAGEPHRYPGSKPRTARKTRSTRVILAVSTNGVLLEKRAASGIWGGLWSLPELSAEESPSQWCQHRFGVPAENESHWPVLRHSFTHFDLDISPILMHVQEIDTIADDNTRLWYNPAAPARIGLPAPITTLLNQLPPEKP